MEITTDSHLWTAPIVKEESDFFGSLNSNGDPFMFFELGPMESSSESDGSVLGSPLPSDLMDIDVKDIMRLSNASDYLPPQGHLPPMHRPMEQQLHLKEDVPVHHRPVAEFPPQQPPGSHYEAGFTGPVKKINRTFHLWEFLMWELYENEAKPNPIIKWLEKDDGIFMILDTRALTSKWARIKKKPKMKYEYLARAIRWLRKGGYFDKVPSNKKYPKKKCFRFGKLTYYHFRNLHSGQR